MCVLALTGLPITISSCLLCCEKITGNKALGERAREFLAEGLDINEDGEFAERSAGNYNQVNDDQMILLSHDICKKIENELEYPGQIKVNVIRESRVVDYAKYVPVGKRGVSTTRAHTLYNPPKLLDYMKEANEKINWDNVPMIRL